MKVRAITLMAGPGGVVQPGSVIDVADDHGRQLIAERYAVAIELPGAPGPIETTMAKPKRETRKRR